MCILPIILGCMYEGLSLFAYIYIPVMLKIRPSQNASSVTVETKGTT